MKTPRARRRALRQKATAAEAFLWRRLRARALLGFKFRRQHPLGGYILDLFCARRRLAIELDGGQHFEAAKMAYDQRRTEYLRSRGITVLRFTNDQVFVETEAILESIGRALGLEIPSP
jgi:very-short-patch-repair endonuclease